MSDSMPDSGRLRAVVLVVAGMLVCVAGVAGVLAVSDATTQDSSQVETGQQLATVLTVTDEEVRHDIGVSTIDAAAEGGDESALAVALADRAAVLTDRSRTIADEFANASAAYENGTLPEQEFAWRLALLNARADAVRDGIDHVVSHTEEVPPSVLEEAGYDAEALAGARARLDPLTGRGLSALLTQYTGETAGSFSVDAGDGLSVEVESEDGTYSREFDREPSGGGSVETGARAALAAARDSLSGTADGAWYPTELAFDRDDGVYELAFVYWSETQVGEAEVAVDGTTGEVFSLEEEREPHDGASVLGIDIRGGSLEPGGTATVVVTLDGDPVNGATVLVNDEPVGTTDSAGTVTLSLPRDDDVEIAVEHLDADAELELAFDPPEDEDEQEQEQDDETENEDEDEQEQDDETENEDEQEQEQDDETENENEDEDEQEQDDETENEDEQEQEQDDETENENEDEDEDEQEQGDETEDEDEQEQGDETENEDEQEQGDETENEDEDEDEDKQDDETENENEDEDEQEQGDETEDETENEDEDEDEQEQDDETETEDEDEQEQDDETETEDEDEQEQDDETENENEPEAVAQLGQYSSVS